MSLEGKVKIIKNAQIMEVKTYDDFTRIRNLNWPDDVFTVKDGRAHRCSPTGNLTCSSGTRAEIAVHQLKD